MYVTEIIHLTFNYTLIRKSKSKTQQLEVGTTKANDQCNKTPFRAPEKESKKQRSTKKKFLPMTKY